MNADRSYIKHIESKEVSRWRESGRFEATTHLYRPSEPGVPLICVPPPLNDSRGAGLVYVEKTKKSIAKTLRNGQLVIPERTTYPTTTRDVMLQILEATGRAKGRDFHLVCSPKWETLGNPDFTAAGFPKVTGGHAEGSLELTVTLYAQGIFTVVPNSSCEVTGPSKILKNTYRAVTIALVNELRTLFDRPDIDVWEVIDAAKTPFGLQAFYPGSGLGRHGISIDPFCLPWLARKQVLRARFIELTGEGSSMMPEYVIALLAESLNQEAEPIKGSKVFLLDVAYKIDIDGPRESRFFVLIAELLARVAVLSHNNPHVPYPAKMRHHELPEMDSVALTAETVAPQGCVMIGTNHSSNDYNCIGEHTQLVLDTRKATPAVKNSREDPQGVADELNSDAHGWPVNLSARA